MDITPAQGQSITPDPVKNSAPNGDTFKRLFGGVHFQFPTFRHDHPAVINVNKVADDKLTTGQRIADAVASGMGSWKFIIIQTTILVLWALLNSVGWWVWKWDVYPFIAMNLLLSCQAAYAAPVIMMSQNRQADKDRLTAQNDYQTDCKGEEEIRYIMEHLDHQDALILQIVKRLEEQHDGMLAQFKQLREEAEIHFRSEAQKMNGVEAEITDDAGDNS